MCISTPLITCRRLLHLFAFGCDRRGREDNADQQRGTHEHKRALVVLVYHVQQQQKSNDLSWCFELLRCSSFAVSIYLWM